MSYSLPKTFFFVILPILGSAHYAKRWYTVLRKGKKSYWKMEEKAWNLF
jgi:hypothetical protein